MAATNPSLNTTSSLKFQPNQTTTMQTPTIPQIAEMLRHHVNHDNDAPRLIVEHILPLVGIDMTHSEVRKLGGQEKRIDDLVDEKGELAEMLRDAETAATEKSGKLEEIIARIERSEIDTETLKTELFALV